MNWTGRVRFSVMVALFALVWASVAHADDDMVFGVDEVGDPALEYLDELISEGQRLYEQQNYEEASLRFFDVLMDLEMGAEAYYPEAEYELARTLFRLELYQGSLSYFGQIAEEGDFHPYFQPALRGLLLLSDVIPGDMTLTRHLARYADHFPDIVPEAYRDRYAYLAGRYFYDNLEYERATELLRSIDDDSEYYARARYIQAISHVADYEAEPAVEAFRDILRYLERQDTPLDRMRGEQRRLLDLTHLGMARVFYSVGRFDNSLAYYDRIDRNSPRWAEALFESSWGYFQVDRFNQALGNLHSLNSPFFEDAYFPEGPILAAVIYFYNCQYDLVRETLYDFDFLYEEGVKEELESILAANPDPIALYEWGQQWRNGEVEGSPELISALQSTLNDRQFRQRFELVESIDSETAAMNSLADSWQTSLLADTLIQESALAQSFSTADAGELVQRRLERLVSELNGLINQQNRILVEVARAERGDVEADVRAGMLLDDRVEEESQLEVTDEQMYWRFDGEYWKDELGYYFFDVRSQCRR